MSILQKLQPLNALEEKSKFFSDLSYSPQFFYEEPIKDKDLTKYGLPEPEYLKLAKKIVKEAYYGRNAHDLAMLNGPELSQDEVQSKTELFLKMHNLDDTYKIIWSSSFTSRASITSDTLKLRLPCVYRRSDFLGMLYHEIGTHALRRLNYQQQPWYQRRRKFKFHRYLPTEEGLAALNSLIPKASPLAYVSALRYVTVDYALHHSFSETWHWLRPYLEDDERCWSTTLRLKRGLSDTALPGAFTKDLVYFKGMIEVWHWLATHNFDCTLLYYGKMSWEDVEVAVELNPDFQPVLPSFFTTNPDGYAATMEEIGRANYFDQLHLPGRK